MFHSVQLFSSIVDDQSISLHSLSIVLISNSTYKEFRGTALGLGQVASGIFRFIGPSLVPMLFAWSTSYNKFPIDYGFSFYVDI